MVVSVVLLALACEKNRVLVSFMFPEKEKVLTAEKKGVSVTLQLSKKSPVEHELRVVNNSDQRVWLENEGIKLSIHGSAIVVPGIRNYDSYIKKANRNAKMLCNNSSHPYLCVDEIIQRGKKYLGKGFPFGAIDPGEERRGYIIFNFPNPVTRSDLTREFRNKLEEGKIFLGGKLKVGVKFGAVIEQCVFPVNLRIYGNTDEMPVALQSFWKLNLN